MLKFKKDPENEEMIGKYPGMMVDSEVWAGFVQQKINDLTSQWGRVEATRPQITKLILIIKEALPFGEGIRHVVVSRVLDKEIASFNDLTKAEASILIDAFTECPRRVKQFAPPVSFVKFNESIEE